MKGDPAVAAGTFDRLPSDRELSKIARDLYRANSLSVRAKQCMRPLICPFAEVLRDVPVRSRVLDVGCGGGMLLGCLAVRDRMKHGVGVDVSEDDLAQARVMSRHNNLEDRLEFMRIEEEAMWPEGPFDVVLLVDVMHHLPAHVQRHVFLKVAGALSEGGRFIYKDIPPRPLWRASANRIHDAIVSREWVRYVSEAQIKEWAAESGFRTIRRWTRNRLWYCHQGFVFRYEPGV